MFWDEGGDCADDPLLPWALDGLWLGGTGVTMTSCTEVTVLAGFASLLLMIRVDADEDVVSGRELNSEFMRDVSSESWRDSTCEELLEDEVEDEEVGTAGAVVFVTICRLMCRG
jgi:hypothetical protein